MPSNVLEWALIVFGIEMLVLIIDGVWDHVMMRRFIGAVTKEIHQESFDIQYQLVKIWEAVEGRRDKFDEPKSTDLRKP